jgi:hypothetical protein
MNKPKLVYILLVLGCALPMLSCIERKLNINICKIIPALGEGQIVYFEVRESVDTIIPPGRFSWRGNFTDFAGPLPPEGLFTLERRAKGGAILESWQFIAPINADGKIPAMNITFPGTVLQANQRFRVNFSPRGGEFFGGQLNLKTKYNAF